MKRMLLTVLTVLLFSSNAMASLWLLEATPVISGLSEFSIKFDDANADNILVRDEISWFSGYQADILCDVVLRMPHALNLATIGGGTVTLVDPENLNVSIWTFLKSDVSWSRGGDQVLWSYTVGEVAPTPIPGAVWLLGSGLAGLIGLRRKLS